MAQERPNKIVELYLLARAHMPELRRSAAEWAGQVREEPRLLWETPAVRYAAYGVGGLLALWLITGLVNLVQPASRQARPEATTADYHVLCTSPECGHAFVINRKFGFRDFPVECPKCRRVTGMAARPCNSSECKGAWVVPQQEADVSRCPRCGTVFPTP